MHKSTKISIFLLRISIGVYFLYAGLSKIINPNWSASGFLNNTQTFHNIYSWFALPQNIGWVNLLNEWGLALVGLALILGIFTKWASLAGIILMILYYFPSLNFPYAGDNAYIVDNHIIYIAVFLVLIKTKAGHWWGMDSYYGR